MGSASEDKTNTHNAVMRNDDCHWPADTNPCGFTIAGTDLLAVEFRAHPIVTSTSLASCGRSILEGASYSLGFLNISPRLPSVSPTDAQPGSSGQTAEKLPASGSNSRMMPNFIVACTSSVTAQTGLPARLGMI